MVRLSLLLQEPDMHIDLQDALESIQILTQRDSGVRSYRPVQIRTTKITP